MIRPRELSATLELFPARTPTLLPATHTNSYALGSRDVLLVEPATPYEDEQRAFLAWARALPSNGRRPVALFATHHHPDHVGGLDVLARELDLPVWAHPETVSRLEPSVQHHVTRRLEDGEALVLDGPIAESWSVLHTPGHAPGHICLHEPASGTVVVGDMVASVGTILIAPGDGDMRIYLQQLARLEALGARLALPAHGEPIDGPSALFRRYIEHRLMREAKVHAALVRTGPGGAPAEELVAAAYDDTPMHLWPLALLSLRAHLEKLAAEGRAVPRGNVWQAAAEGARS
ncbi:MBL fold metallo-hydrolase [Pendulispora albinea]|uniref:MBL fold metallo-hydrolase n=1 Tax=Pendulispora albinea TaxID=2741071 RepID=A0ABZ2LXQ1_9BACT